MSNCGIDSDDDEVYEEISSNVTSTPPPVVLPAHTRLKIGARARANTLDSPSNIMMAMGGRPPTHRGPAVVPKSAASELLEQRERWSGSKRRAAFMDSECGDDRGADGGTGMGPGTGSNIARHHGNRVRSFSCSVAVPLPRPSASDIVTAQTSEWNDPQQMQRERRLSFELFDDDYNMSSSGTGLGEMEMEQISNDMAIDSGSGSVDELCRSPRQLELGLGAAGVGGGRTHGGAGGGKEY